MPPKGRITGPLHWVRWGQTHPSTTKLIAACGAVISPSQEAARPPFVTCVGCLKARLRDARLDSLLDQL
jgi:hypothetical protein